MWVYTRLTPVVGGPTWWARWSTCICDSHCVAASKETWRSTWSALAEPIYTADFQVHLCVECLHCECASLFLTLPFMLLSPPDHMTTPKSLQWLRHHDYALLGRGPMRGVDPRDQTYSWGHQELPFRKCLQGSAVQSGTTVYECFYLHKHQWWLPALCVCVCLLIHSAILLFETPQYP